MSVNGLELERQELSCGLCSDLLREPVTIPCGDNFCRDCVENHWDGQDSQPPYSCPKCKYTFKARPALSKNTMLYTFIERVKTVLHADESYAAPGEIPCDVCPGRKLRAAKSCLSCRVTYCENHLQPHYNVPQFKKHKLTEPLDNLEEEKICAVHREVMNMLCLKDNQSICRLCAADHHKGHEVTWTEAESARLQKELKERRKKIQMRIEQKEKELEELRQRTAGFNSSADAALQLNQETFTQMIKLMKEKKSSMEQQIRSHQHAVKTGLQVHMNHIKEDIADLKKQKSDRELMLQIQDAYEFLLKNNALPKIPKEVEPRFTFLHWMPYRKFIFNKHPIPFCIMALVQIHEERAESFTFREDRDKCMDYAGPITITWDPNTAHRSVSLEPTCNGNECATFKARSRNYPDHPERFSDCVQVLSKEPLNGRCYFEVRTTGGCFIGLTYKSIERKGKGKQCILGLNDKSWACFGGGYTPKILAEEGIGTWVLNPSRSTDRVAVCLDHDKGTLIFYVVNFNSLSALHKVETKFTESLYFGAIFVYPGDSVVISTVEEME